MADELQRLRAERDAALARVAELAAAQDEFLRAVSHDLRAPLRHVTSYAALLSEVLRELPEPPEPVREALGFAATMEQSARHMAAMLDALLAIARARRAPLQPVAIDTRAALLAARATLHGAESAHWEIAAAMPAIAADAALLAQLLTQLLGNALKFSRPVAEPLITVSAHGAAPGRVHITISDNGVGCDMVRAAALPGLFQRLHRDGQFDGVGAGLALCQAIAERHGATLALRARPGQGCAATLDWPAT